MLVSRQLCELRYESVAVGPEGELIYGMGADYEVRTGFQTISGSTLLSCLHLTHARQLLINVNMVEITLPGRFQLIQFSLTPTQYRQQVPISGKQ